MRVVVEGSWAGKAGHTHMRLYVAGPPREKNGNLRRHSWVLRLISKPWGRVQPSAMFWPIRYYQWVHGTHIWA